MKKSTSLVFAFLISVGSCLSAFAESPASLVEASPAPTFSVEALPDLVVAGTNPAQGVSGAFCAFSERGKVIVAGGCNFPDKGPADGGKKVYYDTIWELQLGNSEARWEISERKLPEPVAYGSSCFCWVGGENSQKKIATVFSPFGDGHSTAPLPVAMDNAAAAWMIVAGGNANGVPANKAFSFGMNKDKDSPVPFGWQELPDFPGTPRAQPVCGFVKTPSGKRAFVLVGGFAFDKEKNEATVDCAGVIYFFEGKKEEDKKWERFSAMPAEVSEAGLVGSAVVEYDGGLIIVGGVNAKIFKNALEKPDADYLRHEPEWYKFNADVIFLSFDDNWNAVWKKIGSVPELARAGAAIVPINKEEFVYICGELKPGLRSTKCVRVRIEK